MVKIVIDANDEDVKLIKKELLDRGDEMVSFRQLVERLEEVEEYFKGIPWNLKQIYTNFNILIGEKPCTDAISRQAVLEALRTMYDTHIIETEDGDEYIDYNDTVYEIEQLPPVTPAEKMGYWIDTDNYYQRWKCSECGCHTRDAAPPFCPNCRTKMEEVRNKSC